MSSNQGKLAEDLVAEFLKHEGLKLVNRNFRCRYGEIDLICRDAKVLIFVEVRFRSNINFGNAESSVTYQKQQKLIAAAQFYLSQLKAQPICRFDVVALDKLDKNSIHWIKNAFEA